MSLILLAQTGASANPFLTTLTLGPILLFGGLYIIKVKQLGRRRTRITGKLAIYGGYACCMAGAALLLLSLLSALFSQQIIPVFNTLLKFILYGWSVAIVSVHVLWFFRFGGR